MKSLLFFTGLIGLLFVALACSGDEQQGPPSAGEAPAVAVQPTAEADSEMALFPVTIENCGITFTYEAPPERAVTMNQHVTELMLALELQDHMVGTAYIDDFILPEFQDAYESIEVLAEEYPSREVLLNAEPDFIYGGFSSSFDDLNAGSQEGLMTLGIDSYLTHAVCDEGPDTMEDVYADIMNMGAIFGVPERAAALVTSIKGDLQAIRSSIGVVGEPVRAFLYDSGDDAPYTPVCCGLVTPLIEEAGGTNVFDDVEGRWSTVSWEEVIDRDPEVIILTDAVWSTAEEKIELLNNSPVLSQIAAVQNERFVILKFSSLVPGIRNQTAIRLIAEGLYPEKFP
ncbi:MAG: ABC transporter substrate-binding protein [Chloroflexi bacterium]|nr:ABC transporter substrate-binding protein [Chloroflexota bacterium]MDA1228081.1 ABC transporter substrate-binding protein [Chloroflexota bacterium]